MRAKPTLISGILVCVGCLLGGCSGIGQVAPWEKGNLAKPSMTFDADPLDQRFGQHVYQSKENSSGGSAIGGGGCGCN